MKKVICFAAVLLLFAAGCTTSVCRHYPVGGEQKSPAGQRVIAEIRGRNFGYYLFYGIPLWSGTAHRPNEEEWDLWKHQVRERDIRRMLSARAEQLGADGIEELKIREKSTGFWSLWIIWQRSIDGTCLAVRKPEKMVKKSSAPLW